MFLRAPLASLERTSRPPETTSLPATTRIIDSLKPAVRDRHLRHEHRQKDQTVRTNKPIAQLAIYALALTIRVPGLKLFDIKCAWFNEDEYNEFFPRTLFAKHSD